MIHARVVLEFSKGYMQVKKQEKLSSAILKGENSYYESGTIRCGCVGVGMALLEEVYQSQGWVLRSHI